MVHSRAMVRAFSIALLSCATLIGCGSGSDDPVTSNPTTPTPTTPDPAASSNWDQMEWEKGTWSN